jgi:hypothetical protein
MVAGCVEILPSGCCKTALGTDGTSVSTYVGDRFACKSKCDTYAISPCYGFE